MTRSLAKWVELSANVAVIIVAVLFSAVLVRHYFLTNTRTDITPEQPPFSSPQSSAVVQPGTELSLQGINWAEGEQTLLLALSAKCHYCTESADFYKRLAEARRGNTRLVAVLPQELGEGQEYLKKLGVEVDGVKQSSLASVGVRGTPTLILVDRRGQVIESWAGKLPPDQEAEVLSRLQGERAGR